MVRGAGGRVVRGAEVCEWCDVRFQLICINDAVSICIGGLVVSLLGFGRTVPLEVGLLRGTALLHHLAHPAQQCFVIGAL